MNEFINTFQPCLNGITFKDISILVYSVSHFIFSSFMAFFTFNFYRITDESFTKRFKYLEPAFRDNNRMYLHISVMYSVVTGLTSSALIALQNPSTSSIPFAIIYGLAGFYVLKDKAMALVKNENVKDEIVAVSKSKMSEILNKVEEDENKYLVAKKEIEDLLIKK